MLQVSFIRQNKERILKGLATRNYKEDTSKLIDRIIEWDDTRKETQTSLDELLAKNKLFAKEIGGLFKQGKQEEANGIKQQVEANKTKVKALEEDMRAIKDKLDNGLLQIPNVPHDSVPAGNTDADNEVYKEWTGELPNLGDKALPHWELAKKYNLIDFELGVKITGSGFPLFRGQGARLQRGLINFFLDEASKAGYEEIVPPLLVNGASARATGQLPDKEGQMYYVEKDDLYLIPTAAI